MSGPRATRLSKTRAALLRRHLDIIQKHFQPGSDPVDFVHRYSQPDDQEVAALLASSLAFGRVASFTQVLETLFDLADTFGGPAQWVNDAVGSDLIQVEPLFYRWVRGPDLQRWIRTIGRFRLEHQSVRSFMENQVNPADPDIGSALTALVQELRHRSTEHGEHDFKTLSRGYRHLLPLPGAASASKRWCMFARWMTRDESPDLGLWNIPSSKLIIPLDVHIHRIAQLIGLTRRRDASWKTAVEITNNLRRINPDDPIRYDFVLAHLGISGDWDPQRIAMIGDPSSSAEIRKMSQSGYASCAEDL